MNATTDETLRLDAADARYRIRRERMRERRNSFIVGGMVVLGLGMVLLTGWWWPGLLLAIGFVAAAHFMRRDQVAATVITLLGFVVFPLGLALLSAISVPWLPLGAFLLIASGLIALVRAA